MGIQILRRPNGLLFLSQVMYLQDVLQRLDMFNCRPASTRKGATTTATVAKEEAATARGRSGERGEGLAVGQWGVPEHQQVCYHQLYCNCHQTPHLSINRVEARASEDPKPTYLAEDVRTFQVSCVVAALAKPARVRNLVSNHASTPFRCLQPRQSPQPRPPTSPYGPPPAPRPAIPRLTRPRPRPPIVA